LNYVLNRTGIYWDFAMDLVYHFYPVRLI